MKLVYSLSVWSPNWFSRKTRWLKSISISIISIGRQKIKVVEFNGGRRRLEGTQNRVEFEGGVEWNKVYELTQ